MIRHGLHFECPMCRSELDKDYTIGISSKLEPLGMLLDDSGDGVIVRDNTVEKVSQFTSPVIIHRVFGTQPATLVRLSGKTMLYSTFAQTKIRNIDCFMRVPIASENTRRGRSIRRKLQCDETMAITVNETHVPLAHLMRTLIFPAILIDVCDPPELEASDMPYVED